jgi:hypothetical protein
MDNEYIDILNMLPEEEAPHLWRQALIPNAFVYKDDVGRIGILLTDGGWLGIPVDSKDIQADIAPFSG